MRSIRPLLLSLFVLALVLGALPGCTSDPPGYPRYGLSDEPDVYADPPNYAHGPAFRDRDREDYHCRRDRSDPDRMICDRTP